MQKCGYRWVAPYIRPPDQPHVGPKYYVNNGQRTRPREVCVLTKGHDGDHRSAFKVIAKNVRKSNAEGK